MSADSTDSAVLDAVGRPPGATRVLLIRPGATSYDEQGRIQGVLDLPLTDTGWTQVGRLTDRLANAELSGLYCGPASSAQSTAEGIGKRLNLRARMVPEFRNLDQGLWQGLHVEEVRRRHAKVYRQWLEEPRTICPPEGESVAEAIDRVRGVLRTLLRRHRGETIGLVVPEPLAQLISGHLRREAHVPIDDVVSPAQFEWIDVLDEPGRHSRTG